LFVIGENFTVKDQDQTYQDVKEVDREHKDERFSMKAFA
jgi:hypothetical protein